MLSQASGNLELAKEETSQTLAALCMRDLLVGSFWGFSLDGLTNPRENSCPTKTNKDWLITYPILQLRLWRNVYEQEALSSPHWFLTYRLVFHTHTESKEKRSRGAILPSMVRRRKVWIVLFSPLCTFQLRIPSLQLSLNFRDLVSCVLFHLLPAKPLKLSAMCTFRWRDLTLRYEGTEGSV